MSSSADAASTPLLYSYFRSSCSWRLRIALNIKNIPYDQKTINLLQAEQRNEEYRKVNPAMMVPAFVQGTTTLTQSFAILEYLEEAYPDTTRLLPTSPRDRAIVRALALTVVVDIQPLQNSGTLAVVADSLGPESKAPWAKKWIERGLAALEEKMRGVSGKYCFGDTVTLADVCLAPQLYGAERFGVDIARFPIIRSIARAYDTHPAFVKASYVNQPDTPEGLRV